MAESAKIGAEVKAIFASDADSGVNGDVSYSIISGNRHGLIVELICL